MTVESLQAEVAALRHLLTAQEQALDTLRMQHTLALHLSTARDATHVFRQLLDTLCSLHQVDGGLVYRTDVHLETVQPVACCGLAPEIVEHLMFPQSRSRVVRLTHQGQPIYDEHTHLLATLPDATVQQIAQTVALIPIHSAGTSGSGVVIISRTCDTFAPEVRSLLEALATQAGAVLDRIATDKTTPTTSIEQALADLADSEARYRTLVETSPGAILLTDLDSTIHFCNQRSVELFGYSSKEELCGVKGTDLVVLHEGTDPLTYAEMVAGSGNIRSIEYTLQQRDGQQFVAEVSSSIVNDANGHPNALIIVVHDISQRKHAEEALTAANNELVALNDILMRSRNFLRVMFDGMDDGLVLLDHVGIVRIINTTMASLLNNSPQQLVGQRWADISPFTEEDSPGQPLLLEPSRPRTQRRRTRYQTPDGTIRILDVQTISLQSASQDDEQVIIHVVDVTEPMTLQARVLENERFAASGRLAASVAHEINTPLQSIAFALELAQIAPEYERGRYLADITEEINWVGRIVHQLLDLYRPGAATYGPVDIHTLLERILLLIGKRIREQGVVIKRTIAPDLPAPHGRADELMQVILNLLVNALDAMPDGGTLHITAIASPPTWMNIAISDSGCGIRPELQTKIFEPFVTTKAVGTGLGLSISTQIIEQHGGHITVASEIDQGSTFTIVLPIQYTDERTHPGS